MTFSRKPLIPKVHLGPNLINDPDRDTAKRLTDAMPYIGDSSKAFAKSLIGNQSMYGWSDKQRDWANILLEQARDEYRRRRSGQAAAARLKDMLDGREPAKLAEPRVSNPAMARILGLFKHASDGIKKPILRLMVGGRMANLKLSTRSDRSSLVLFWTDAPQGQGFAGAVDDTGAVRAYPHYAENPSHALAIVAALDAFADPEAAAKGYAEATKSKDRPHGNCCFCGLHLTDKRSVVKGYGPICASKWCLPWGGE